MKPFFPSSLTGLFSLWNSKLCENFIHLKGKTAILFIKLFLFAILFTGYWIIRMYINYLQAAYNVGGHCINAYVIQNSILGIRPHYSAPVWLHNNLCF